MHIPKITSYNKFDPELLPLNPEWLAIWALCEKCKYEWPAVYQVGDKSVVECPKCGSKRVDL